MIPVSCMTVHNPPESYGDCLRACVASILELPSADVPHFYRDGCDNVQADAELRGFLNTQGLGLVTLMHPAPSSIEDVQELVHNTAPGVPYILFGHEHCVVCHGDKIHNPNWAGGPLEPPKNGNPWIVAVFAKL